MNKVVERVKDLFYDATDYVLILIIVVVVSGIIAWRLDLLFAKSPNDSPSTNTATSQNSNISPNEKDISANDLIEKEKNSKKGIINISIPEGSLPPTIANILLDNGLISDKYDFLKKSQELGLDTKLRSGEYEIDKSSSTEDIIRIIARQ